MTVLQQQSKQPQSFPDRLAFIQKQKDAEEAKTFARSSVRALKVSKYIIYASAVFFCIGET